MGYEETAIQGHGFGDGAAVRGTAKYGLGTLSKDSLGTKARV